LQYPEIAGYTYYSYRCELLSLLVITLSETARFCLEYQANLLTYRSCADVGDRKENQKLRRGDNTTSMD
jgi:hypothetical protein